MKNKLPPYIEKDIILNPIFSFIKEFPKFTIWAILMISLIIINFWFFNATEWIKTKESQEMIWTATQNSSFGLLICLVFADTFAIISIIVFCIETD